MSGIWDFGLHEPSPDAPAEGVVARAGQPLAGSVQAVGEEAIIEAVKTVFDPEIPVNIYDLGLIYNMSVMATGEVELTMTLTAPGCPVAGILPQQVADAVAGVEGAGEVEVRLVWEPAWSKERMSEDARLALDL